MHGIRFGKFCISRDRDRWRSGFRFLCSGLSCSGIVDGERGSPLSRRRLEGVVAMVKASIITDDLVTHEKKMSKSHCIGHFGLPNVCHHVEAKDQKRSPQNTERKAFARIPFAPDSFDFSLQRSIFAHKHHNARKFVF